MEQCNLHFDGDLTAHAATEWFLTQLLHSNNIFTEDFDKFCEDLNAVCFIDCLRKQVKDKNLLGLIESIAEKLYKNDEFRKFPNLSVLLFSIAQSSLQAYPSVKETKIYKVGEKLYNNFKDATDSCNDVALKAGFQLSKFQKDLEWNYQFSEFKYKHHKRLNSLRRKYFSVDNPALFSLRIVERYRWNIDDLQSFEHLNLQSFEKLKPDSDFLHPMCLKLPIRTRSTEAMRIAINFLNTMRTRAPDTHFCEKLANKFRILQWDIFCRDLIVEDRTGELSFYPITKIRNIQGMSKDDFLSERIKQIRSFEWSFSPSESGILTDLRDNSALASNIVNDEKKIKHYLESFRFLMSEIADTKKTIHEDFIHSFANSVRENILLQDGELSFFSLLWLLRRAATQKGVNIDDWLLGKNESKESAVRFCPSGSIDDKCSSYEFAEECGFIIRLSDLDHCVSTTRWRSLIAWLKRHNHNLRERYAKDQEFWREVTKRQTGLKNNDPVLKQVPVKRLDYNEPETSFVKNLWDFLAGNRLETILKDLEKSSFDVSMMTCSDFVSKQLKPLVDSLGEFLLLQVESPVDDLKESDGFRDAVLLRCCRAVFLPLEHLFRAYWPCELHLFIQALNWEESHIKGLETAPTSLGFATIVGQVEKDGDDFEHWRVPYRSLFSTLSADLTLPIVKDASEQTGKRTQKGYFAHQTSRLLNTVWSDGNRNKLGFESNFALWMAKTQVVEIWGDFRIDPEQQIYEDEEFRRFSEKIGVNWKELENTQIVEELVYFGLQGGIDRSLDSGTPSFRRYVSEIQRKLRSSRDNPEKVKKILDEVLRSLSFYFPDTPPPNWVTTKAFLIFFYHGMRQAAYHALETFVFIDDKQENKKNPCLWVKWTNQHVWICNRGEVNPKEHLAPDFKAKDHEFFKLFEEKTDGKFVIQGPKPVDSGDDIWQLIIRKEEL